MFYVDNLWLRCCLPGSKTRNVQIPAGNLSLYGFMDCSGVSRSNLGQFKRMICEGQEEDFGFTNLGKEIPPQSQVRWQSRTGPERILAGTFP